MGGQVLLSSSISRLFWKSMLNCFHIEQEQDEALQEVASNLSRIALVIDSVKKNADNDRTDYINVKSYTNYTLTAYLAVLGNFISRFSVEL